LSGSLIQLQSAASKPLVGTLVVPGDKSISHRSVMLGAIAEGETQVSGLLMGADVLATVAAFRAMGVQIDLDEHGSGVIHGVGKDGLRAPSSALDMGNSGTAMRLLAGILAGQPFVSSLIGDASLSVRPMARVAKPLQEMGASLATGEAGRPPLSFTPVEALQNIDYQSPVASAQVKSCILLAGLYAQGKTRVNEPRPTRDHSERMLSAFGADIQYGEGWAQIGAGSRLRGQQIQVPADISSAAFWLVAASIVPGSELTLPNVGINPRRAGVIAILRQMGANLVLENRRDVGGEPVADLTVRAAPLKGIEIDSARVADAIDEFPVIFVAASMAEGVTVLRGAAELRVKESDRIAVMATALSKLGVDLTESDDGITIRGGNAIAGGFVDSAGDHRCAMALAVAGLVSHEPVQIDDCANISTSYPSFMDDARGLRCPIEALAPIITIDGPSGSGKGTISSQVAAEMGWQLLDSGALYRVVAYAALRDRVALDDRAKLAEIARDLDVIFDFATAGPGSIQLNGEAVGESIRSEQVAAAASRVAAIEVVRAALLARQREFRQFPGLVADGRDMGTVVFPFASRKVYLTASVEERAKRRHKQLKDKDNDVNLRALLDEIRARDERDSQREIAPLRPAADALVLDTTQLSVKQVVDQVLALLR